MPNLQWISDHDLNKAVKHLLDKAKQAKVSAINAFGKNVIDPFSALFEVSGFGMSFEEWFKAETARQAQKTLQNHVGAFHQTVLGSCAGWTNMQTGSIIDLVSKDKKVIAEVKNKYNTISGGNLAKLYHSLDSAVMNKTSIYKSYTAYYVSIIPAAPNPYDIPFVPSDKEKGQKCPSNPQIRCIDGASFYSIVTGQPKALEQLFDVLPKIICEINANDEKLDDLQELKNYFTTAYN